MEGWSIKPLVSIVTPTYNTPPQLLRECLDSVVAQTPAPGTELEAVMTCVLTLSRAAGGEGPPTGGLGGPESPPSLTSERGSPPRERKNTP